MGSTLSKESTTDSCLTFGRAPRGQNADARGKLRRYFPPRIDRLHRGLRTTTVRPHLATSLVSGMFSGPLRAARLAPDALNGSSASPARPPPTRSQNLGLRGCGEFHFSRVLESARSGSESRPASSESGPRDPYAAARRIRGTGPMTRAGMELGCAACRPHVARCRASRSSPTRLGECRTWRC